MWGVVRVFKDDSIHIVPVDDNDDVRPPHILDLLCPCHPSVADWQGIIHEEIQ